jgi:hypothetical protein
MQKKVGAGVYRDLNDLEKDVMLMLDNCIEVAAASPGLVCAGRHPLLFTLAWMQYYGPSHSLTKDAENLRVFYEAVRDRVEGKALAQRTGTRRTRSSRT